MAQRRGIPSNPPEIRNSPPWVMQNPPVSTPHTNVILCRRVQYYTHVIRSLSCLETKSRVSYKTAELLWPVVQNLVSANPRQKLNSFSFCTSTYKSTLKLLGTKTTVDPDRICEVIFQAYQQACWKFLFKLTLTQG